uniref:Uncharacterized protein n=1 Tax=Leersia perrieri TaxID=77586 RepID=A0A0D9X7P4_9ORYZ
MTRLFEDAPEAITSHRHNHTLKLDCEHKEYCNFHLHTCCALATETLEHDLFPGCKFVLLHEPPPPAGGRMCDACGGGVDAHGLVYHSNDGNRIRPPPVLRRIVVDGHAFVLTKEESRRCRKRTLWFYPSSSSYTHGKEVLPARWDKARPISMENSSGQHFMQAAAPILDGVLKDLPRGRGRRATGGDLERFMTKAIRVIISLIVGDPTAMIATVAGVIFS